MAKHKPHRMDKLREDFWRQFARLKRNMNKTVRIVDAIRREERKSSGEE